MEFWLHGFAVPGRVVEQARRAEALGYAGLLLADSQNLTADIWVELALAAAVTSRLRPGSGTTNPLTRHLAVTAAAATTLQVESGGRALLGFAQGDSALSQVGLRRLPVADFELTLAMLQGLLRGEEVERLRRGVELARGAGGLRLTLGAYLNVAVDSDRAVARDLVRGSVATFARFSSQLTDELSEVTRHGVRVASGGYQRDRHGQATAGFAQALPDEFIDRFAVAGTPQEVSRRLTEIRDCGIERVIVVPGSLDTDPAAVARSCERLALEVMPALSVATQSTP
jgi:5,10-methylenetetrahydromethanopterin reductase